MLLPLSSRYLGLALLLSALACLLPESVRAQDKTLPPELAAVPQDAFIFAYLRPAELWNGEPLASLRTLYPQWPAENAKAIGDNLAETESFIIVYPRQGEFTPSKEPTENMVFIETTVKPFDRSDVLEKVLSADSLEKKHQDKTYFESGPSAPFVKKGAVYFVNNRTYMYAMSSAVLKRILEGLDRPAAGPLAGALSLAAKKHQVVVGVNLDDPIWQANRKHLADAIKEPERRFELLEPTIPAAMLKPLLETKSALATVDLAKDSRVRIEVRLNYADAARADDAMGTWQDFLTLGRVYTVGRFIHQLGDGTSHRQTRKGRKGESVNGESRAEVTFLSLLLKQAEAALRGATFERRQATVRIQAEGQFDIAFLRGKAKIISDNYVAPVPPVVKLDARRESMNNLKQMMLAMHIFHDVYKLFPAAAICSKDGTPLLSWRVAILPYIEEGPLYHQFKLDEPWDSPNNIKLLPRMPKIYAPIGVKTKEANTTFYQVLVGKDTAFELMPDVKAPFGARGMWLAGITDGTSNTIGIVEAHDPVFWTKPSDVEFDVKKPLPKLGGTLFKDGFHCAMMDGSVRFVKPAPPGVTAQQAAQRSLVSEETLRHAIIRHDGFPLGPDW